VALNKHDIHNLDDIPIYNVRMDAKSPKKGISGEAPRPFTSENPENRYICEENELIFINFETGIEIDVIDGIES